MQRARLGVIPDAAIENFFQNFSTGIAVSGIISLDNPDVAPDWEDRAQSPQCSLFCSGREIVS